MEEEGKPLVWLIQWVDKMLLSCCQVYKLFFETIWAFVREINNQFLWLFTLMKVIAYHFAPGMWNRNNPSHRPRVLSDIRGVLGQGEGSSWRHTWFLLCIHGTTLHQSALIDVPVNTKLNSVLKLAQPNLPFSKFQHLSLFLVTVLPKSQWSTFKETKPTFAGTGWSTDQQQCAAPIPWPLIHY